MMYVKADSYNQAKELYGDMVDMKTVDLNCAYVALDVTKASKDSPTDMDKSAECNLKRFGLEQY